MGPAQLRAASGCGHGESPWEGTHGAALGRISVLEWAVLRMHPAELWAGQAACTLSGEVGAGLDWPGCTEGHLPASSSTSPAGLLLPLLMETEQLGSESCTQRALLQQGQPSRAVCSKGINLELAKGW